MLTHIALIQRNHLHLLILFVLFTFFLRTSDVRPVNSDVVLRRLEAPSGERTSDVVRRYVLIVEKTSDVRQENFDVV